MKLIMTTSLVAVLTVVCGEQHAQALLIDNFETGMIAASGAGSFPMTQGGLSPDVLGGERDTSLTGDAGVTLEIDDTFSPDQFAYTEPVGRDGTATLRYDGAGTLDADLTDLGMSDRFILDVASGTAIGALVTIRVTDTAAFGSDVATSTFALSALGDVEVEFTDFVGGSVNFDHVAVIELVIPSGVTGNSVVLNSFETANVPEPTSIALLGMGAVGLMGYGWRRKKKVMTE